MHVCVHVRVCACACVCLCVCVSAPLFLCSSAPSVSQSVSLFLSARTVCSFVAQACDKTTCTVSALLRSFSSAKSRLSFSMSSFFLRREALADSLFFCMRRSRFLRCSSNSSCVISDWSFLRRLLRFFCSPWLCDCCCWCCCCWCCCCWCCDCCCW